jgi:hypothetical protein
LFLWCFFLSSFIFVSAFCFSFCLLLFYI